MTMTAVGAGSPFDAILRSLIPIPLPEPGPTMRPTDTGPSRVPLPAPDPAMATYREAIGKVESSGSGGYSAIGKRHPKYGLPLGRYQVMESNLPAWSKKHLGRVLSPREFLADPAAQDTIFDKEFGSYVAKYGNPEDAASEWFTGGPRSAKSARATDLLGTSGSEYVAKFNRARGADREKDRSVLPTDPSVGGVLGPEAQTPAPGIPAPTARDPWRGMRERTGRDPWAGVRQASQASQEALAEQAELPDEALLPDPRAERAARLDNITKYTSLAAGSPVLSSMYRPDKLALLRRLATI